MTMPELIALTYGLTRRNAGRTPPSFAPLRARETPGEYQLWGD